MNYVKRNTILKCMTGIVITSLLFSSLFVISHAEKTNSMLNSLIDTESVNIINKAHFFSKMPKEGSLLYVGGSGPGNFSSIQEAVDNATDGDTIIVYSGVYYENVEITKEISLIGENTTSTIIDGGNEDSTVTINNGGIFFRSFTVRNGKYHGIYLENSHNSLILDTYIYANGESGIFCFSCINCSIDDNIIIDNKNGITLQGFSRYCTVINNTISNQSNMGIFLKESYENIVKDSYIKYNNIGIYTLNCNNTIILNNSICNNSYYGIESKQSINNQFNINQIINNKYGIKLSDASSNNIIKGNTIKICDPIAPLAIDDSFTTQIDTPIQCNITQNDHDRDGKIDHSSIQIVTNPNNGTILDINNGIISYLPDTGFTGFDFFTYHVKDQQQYTSNIAMVTIHVIDSYFEEEIDQIQQIQNAYHSLYGNWRFAQSFHSNATMISKVELYLKKTGNPTGTIQLNILKGNISGDIVFSTTKNASEINNTYEWISFDSSDFLVDSSKEYYLILNTSGGNFNNCYHWGCSDTDQYSNGILLLSYDNGITWSGSNTSDFCFATYSPLGVAPVSANDIFRTAIGTSLIVPAPGILKNDHDYDEAPYVLNAYLINNVAHGFLNLHTDGSFDYTPNYNFSGIDFFTYIASDGEHNSSITFVTINVSRTPQYCISVPYTEPSSTDNVIYHNNFLSGTYSPLAIDYYQNHWDSAPLGQLSGNYWSDFNEYSEGALDKANDGVFDDCYTISDGTSQDNYPLTTLWVPSIPTANFSWVQEPPAHDLMIAFSDTSQGYGHGFIVDWNWSFGDGNSSNQQSPNHQYYEEGIYNVTLRITDDKGFIDSITKSVVVRAVSLVVDFMWTPSDPTVLDTIQFIDLSVDIDGKIINWTWDFGDGNTSYHQFPLHQYEEYGTYNVTLTVTDKTRSQNSTTKTINVSNAALVARFSYFPNYPRIYENISFFDESYDGTGTIVNWSWDFGDGNSSFYQHPIHSYILAGNYTVCLTVTNDTGHNNSHCKVIPIATGELSIDVNQSIFDIGFRLRPGWNAAQDFSPSHSILSRIELYMTKFASPSGNVTMQICEDSASGTVVFEGMVSPGDVPAFPTYAWVSVEVGGVVVVPGETYVIVLKDAVGATEWDCLLWGFYRSAPYGSGGPYDGGWFWFQKKFQPYWFPATDWDYTFKTYGI